MNSFIDLYNELKTTTNFLEWLSIPWVGKDKQESAFRLFVKLKLIPQLSEFKYCNGKLNDGTLSIVTSFRDLFYKKDGSPIMLKDSGDKSDLSGMNENKLLICTSKNMKKEHVTKLDIEHILCYYNKYYADKELVLCIVTRDKHSTVETAERAKSKDMSDYVKNSILIDWSDLNQAFYNLKYTNLDMKYNKKMLLPKLHQLKSIIKVKELMDKGFKNALVGDVPRSGKTYTAAGCIINCLDSKNNNFLIITTAPNETFNQYIETLECAQLEDFNIQIIKGGVKVKKECNNIYLCSKQYLQTKVEDTTIIKELKNINFKLVVVDEVHQGGSTEKSKDVLDVYGKDSFKLYMTATYNKPVNSFNIPRERWCLWDLEDIRMCKNIKTERCRDKLKEKHGNDIIERFSVDSIIKEYSKYPEFIILTNEITNSVVKEINQYDDYGWSPKACLLLKQDFNKEIPEFQNEKETLKLMRSIFGKKDKRGVYDDENCFLKRIENICKGPEYNSRYVGNSEEPIIIMAFLPMDNIDMISKALTSLLNKYNVVPNMEIVSINSKETNNPKQVVNDAFIKAKTSKKEALLVLSGKQCSLGVTFDNCDIVLLLNNTESFDPLFQMMFRCMTPAKNKKCGFVIDANDRRNIDPYVNYSKIISPNLTTKDALRYMYIEKIIVLNPDDRNYNEPQNFIDTIYNKYLSRINIMSEINRINNVIIPQNISLLLNNLLLTKVKIAEDESDYEEGVNKGLISKKEDKKDKRKDEDESDYEEEEVNTDNQQFREILKLIIPLLCILSINNNHLLLKDIFLSVIEDKQLCDIFESKLDIWNINDKKKLFKIIENIYKSNMSEDLNEITKSVKETLLVHKGDLEKLSELIDKYLPPTKNEKKSHAEVSTPHTLRNEMLDKIDTSFWSNPNHTVFEPCSGKGGFLIDITSRFMEGLKDIIKDKKLRYKHIVENCIYFSDISPTNIFINKLILDPDNKYKLNFNIGDTLDIDIEDKWDILCFDAVIGNPPWNDTSKNHGAGHKLWDIFMSYSINRWVCNDGYLLFVHPPLWRQYNSKLLDLVKKYDLKYVEIHNEKDGRKVFRCSTRYDWYLLKKSKYKGKTTIKDEVGKEVVINLKNWDFIPNSCFKELEDLTKSSVKHEIIADRSNYGADKKWVSKEKNSEFKHPVVYGIYKTKEPEIRYSNRNDKGHFKISKVIFTSNIQLLTLDDKDGKYGLTQWVYGICCKKDEVSEVSSIFKNNKFKEVLQSIKYGKVINDKILKLFKKDFWKDYVVEH